MYSQNVFAMVDDCDVQLQMMKLARQRWHSNFSREQHYWAAHELRRIERVLRPIVFW